MVCVMNEKHLLLCSACVNSRFMGYTDGARQIAIIQEHIRRRSLVTPTLMVDQALGDYQKKLDAGPLGNYETLDVMADLIRRDDGDAAIIDWANRITDGIKGHNHYAILKAIFDYCRARILYRRNPLGFQRVQDARRTIALGYGACSDKTVLLGTLLGALGYKVRLAIISYVPPSFQHVFLQVYIIDKWVSLDPTPEEAIIGWESKGYVKRTFPVYDSSDGDTLDALGIVPLVAIGIKTAIPLVTGLIGKLFGGARRADEDKAHDAIAAVVQGVDLLEQQVKAGQLLPADAKAQYAQIRASYVQFVNSGQITVASVKKAMMNEYDPSRCEYICSTDKRIAAIDSLAPAPVSVASPAQTTQQSTQTPSNSSTSATVAVNTTGGAGVLSQQFGPLPLWGWLALAGGGYLLTRG